MPYINGSNVHITCQLYGGNPKATLSFECAGKRLEELNQTTSTTAISVLNFNIDGTFNNRTCTCVGKHPLLSNNNLQNRITLTVNGRYHRCDSIVKLHKYKLTKIYEVVLKIYYSNQTI